jgi:DNA-binding NarL/FixJ family response regulator
MFMSHFRILVADDQDFVRRRICATLTSNDRFEVCAEAVNGKEAVEKAMELKPDLVVMDITMPVMNGLEAARNIAKLSPMTPILILSVHNSRQVVEEAQRIGVAGYVTKTEASKYLLPAVNAVLQKETFFPPNA